MAATSTGSSGLPGHAALTVTASVECRAGQPRNRGAERLAQRRQLEECEDGDERRQRDEPFGRRKPS